MNKVVHFIGIIFILYLGYSLFHFLYSNLNYKEGMETATSTNSIRGIAGNAEEYNASIKAAVIRSQDTLLISKYRKDYENVILNLDDLVNNLMLSAALNIDNTNPQAGLQQISNLNQTKTALNNIMKFIDSSR
jgi:hypothetical protein